MWQSLPTERLFSRCVRQKRRQIIIILCTKYSYQNILRTQGEAPQSYWKDGEEDSLVGRNLSLNFGVGLAKGRGWKWGRADVDFEVSVGSPGGAVHFPYGDVSQKQVPRVEWEIDLRFHLRNCEARKDPWAGDEHLRRQRQAGWREPPAAKIRIPQGNQESSVMEPGGLIHSH